MSELPRQIDDEWFSSVGSGAGLVAGITDRHGAPQGIRGWAVRFPFPGERRARMIVGNDEGEIGEWAVGTRVAITGAEIMTLTARQLKGDVTSVAPLDDDDVAAYDAQSADFMRIVHMVDAIPMALLERMRPNRLVMIEFEVDEVYDQTPGPHAGARVSS